MVDEGDKERRKPRTSFSKAESPSFCEANDFYDSSLKDRRLTGDVRGDGSGAADAAIYGEWRPGGSRSPTRYETLLEAPSEGLREIAQIASIQREKENGAGPRAEEPGRRRSGKLEPWPRVKRPSRRLATPSGGWSG